MALGLSAAEAGESTEKLSIAQGDFNEPGSVTASDAVYLLCYTLFGGRTYPLNSFADLNGDGTITAVFSLNGN